jgi:hypothetical protein
LQQGELRPGPGEGIYAAVQVDPPLASKTTGLDDKQLYFHVAHHTQVGVPRKNLSTEQRKNPALGLIRHWLRPVNNYKIIIIQSHHWTQLKESEKQITSLTKLQLKGKWDENEIMFRRNNKEFCWIL